MAFNVIDSLQKFMKPAGSQVAPAAAPVQGTPPAPAKDANGNVVNPDPAKNNNDPTQADSPMSAYAKLFEPINTKDAPKAPEYNLTPDITSKAAQGMDFMSDMPAELQQSLQEGKFDTQAVTAMINHAARNAYARAMEHGSALTNKFVGSRSAFDLQHGLPTEVQNILARNKVSSLPSVANNPVAKKHLEFIASQFRTAHPEMSADEIASNSQKYFQDMAAAIGGTTGKGGSGGSGGGAADAGMEFDYEAYLTQDK